MKKKNTHAKSQHYQLKWNILDAVKIAEDFAAKHGNAEIDYPTLKKIYTGNLLEALYFKKIVNNQKYGCTFFADIELEDGSRGIVERSIQLSEPMKLTEFFDGYDNCYVNRGNGLKTKGWKGAGDFWLSMMDEEFAGATCHNAWAIANCLVKPVTGRKAA
ncbi:hypothetical protein [Acinetobacter puyangensis]|uniref:hypothetical protein n=1 Tax=Acinetobacter puyangensis TaxID=1096779 RepID=UPI003A4E18C8